VFCQAWVPLRIHVFCVLGSSAPEAEDMDLLCNGNNFRALSEEQ
jgi:hypothetical protein